MAGPYLYLVVVLLVLGILGFKMYMQSQSPIESRHRPASLITEDDIEAAVRAKRIAEAIQLYGLLYQCDLAEATEAVKAMAESLKAAEATHTEPTSPEQSHDQGET